MDRKIHIKIPKTLPKDAKKIYRKVANDICEQVNFENKVVCDLIENYAMAKHIIDRAQVELADMDLTEEDKAHGGMLKKNPLHQIIKDNQKQMLDIFKALNIDTKPKVIDKDPMEDLIGGQR